jgi:hypothetical protein
MKPLPYIKIVLVGILFCLLSKQTNAQVADSLVNVPGKVVNRINNRVAHYNKRLDKQTTKYLRRLEKQELKLQRKLAQLDSTKAAQLFAGTKEKYAILREGLKQKTDKVTALTGKYLPHIDSLGMSIKFLGENNQYISKLKNGKSPSFAKAMEGKKKITGTLDKYKELQQKLHSTGDIQQYIKERKQLLKETLSQYDLGKYLEKFSKEGYYAVQQISEIKEALNDPSKFETLALKLLNQIPAFKKFASEKGMLGNLFSIPAGQAQNIAGLQTRASVSTLIQNQVASGGPNAQQVIQQNIQQAQSQLSQLKDKVSKFGGGSSDVDIPDFTPNSQKTKTFWQRINITTDLQTNKGSRFLPNIADIAAGVSYKIDDKKQIGTQLVYKAGLGNGLNNIRLTHQGFGYRFFADMKLKKGFWLSAGYENNYMYSFKTIDELRINGLNPWQESALAGISKKYKLKKKGGEPSFAKASEGEMKLLYDFLWNKKVGGQRIVWRTGINF